MATPTLTHLRSEYDRLQAAYLQAVANRDAQLIIGDRASYLRLRQVADVAQVARDNARYALDTEARRQGAKLPGM